MNFAQTFFSRQFLWEIVRIITVGTVSLLFYLQVVPLPVLLAVMLFGLYSLVKTAFTDLIKERKVGTELFITVAVIVSVLGKEYLAGSVVLMIILIAEYIASASGERARASIKELIGSVPKTALVKREGGEETVPIESLKIGDVILVRAGEKIPVDGKVVGGSGSVNQAPITGESLPEEKQTGSTAFAGTILELGALDVEMTKAGLAAFVSGSLDKSKSRSVSLISGAVLLGLSICLANYTSFSGLLILWALAGLGQSLAEIPSETLIGENIAAEDQGKVYDSHFAFSHLWWAVAYPVAGFSGSAYPQENFLYGGLLTLVMAIVAIVFFYLPLPSSSFK